MRKTFVFALAFLIFAVMNFQSASAQFPKIPKIPRPKPQPTPTETARPAPASEPEAANRPQTDTSSATSARDVSYLARVSRPSSKTGSR